LTDIFTSKLSKSYEDVLAVDSLDLSIKGEIYGLLGPNGSGKTTTVGMLTTLLSPSSGNAQICGHDVTTEPKAVRECISYVPQYMAVDIRLTGRENIDFYAKLYGIRDKVERKRRVNYALDVMDLNERADDLTKTYSGGMQRRLELAQALTHQPKVLFLDEPTVGLDVIARKMIWEHIANLKKNGITIFVTTHQMEEAERYCDRVGILKKGIVVKEGTPSHLKSALKSIITIKSDGKMPSTLPDDIDFIGNENGSVVYATDNGSNMLPSLIKKYDEAGIHVYSSMVRDPTLEDIYLMSVGTGTEDAEQFNRAQIRRIIMKG